MKRILIALTLAFGLARAAADVERILSTSPDGRFELVAIKHEQPAHEEHVLRDVNTKNRVTSMEDTEEDYINPGFGSPQIEWSPDSRILILSAKLYRHLGEFSAVFRISGDLKLVHIALPKDTEPARWNPDGTLVLRVKREETYKFDPAKRIFVPSPTEHRK